VESEGSRRLRGRNGLKSPAKLARPDSHRRASPSIDWSFCLRNKMWNNLLAFLQTSLYAGRMLTKREAENCLSPHYRTLKKCLDGGWEAWHEYYSHRHVVLDARARAAIVYCEIINLAKTLFAESDVKVVRKRAMYVLYIGDDIVLRFKKLRNGAPSNVPTGQQRLFHKQEPIPGILPGTFVSAGYELDRIERAIARTLVVARLDGKEVWSLDLNISGGDQGVVEVMPIAPTSPTKTRRVRLRREEAEKESQGR
jgi:hypothetical protein